jgi:hypothetical protein
MKINPNFLKINPDEIPYQLWIFFSVGVIISVTSTLGLENIKKCGWKYGLNLVAVLLWGIYCFFLPATENQARFDTQLQIAILGAVFATTAFFISFLKKNQNIAFWVFSKTVVTQLFLSALFSLVLFSGLALALYSLNSLFDIEISPKAYQNLAVICFVLFSPVYLLANTPDQTNKYNTELSFEKAFKIFGLYILLPILGVYTLILYAYLLKIVVTWELPNGWVSTLVSILAIGGLLIILLLYPVWLKKENKLAVFVSRYFGLLIFPLVVLMSVGIFRRIYDYGISINRCYILILNLWFYGIFIYRFFSKSKSVKWILISPTLIFLLVSIGPWRISNVTKHTISNKLEKSLQQLDFLKDGKISITDSPQFFETMETQQKTDIGESLKYLGKTYGIESVQSFFHDDIKDQRISGLIVKLGLNSNDKTKDQYFSFEVKDIQIPEINQYNSFIYIDLGDKKDVNKMTDFSMDDEGTLLIVKNNRDNREFTISIQQNIRDLLKPETTNKKIYFSDTNENIVIKGNDYILYIKKIGGRYDEIKDKLTIETFQGLFFYK